MTTRLLRRYSNRKLYDTSTGGYVTLAEVAAMIRAGDSVRAEVHGTKEDVTTSILAQIIFEEERAAPRLPVNALRRVIRTGVISD